MTPAIIIAVSVAAVALMFWNAGNMRRFESDYRYDDEFQGNRYECMLRFANLDYGIRSLLGANGSALYLLAAPKHKVRWWGNRAAHGRLKTNLQIPWTDLAWQEKTILLKDCIWFEIPERKIYFYVPRDVGEKILSDAGRKVPLLV